MKRILIALCALAISTVVTAQPKPADQIGTPQKKVDDVVKFAELKHDFGKVKQNKDGKPEGYVNYDFAFQNTGSAPVVITNAMASCGCTTPVWPKAPVAKNKSDKISAGYNAANLGTFSKTITVTVAGYDQPVTLTITGEVLSADDYAKYEVAKPKKNS